MAGRMLVIGLLGLIGITLPFLAAYKILDMFYAPKVTGFSAPLPASIAGFGVAALIATLAFFITLRATKSLQGTSVTAEGLDEPEELPE